MLNILFYIIIAAEAVLVPLFLKYSWPKKTWTSFTLKTIASCLFLSAGFVAVQISGNTSQYAELMMWGLFCGVIGDILLHVISDKMHFFIVGAFSFLVGHIFYINAFQAAKSDIAPDLKMFTWQEVLAALVMPLLILLFILIKKVKIGKLLLPLLAYTVTISFMVIKAVGFYYEDWMWGMKDGYTAEFFTVVVAAILFFLSDLTLAILMLEKFKKMRPIKIFNIYSYYIAQLLLVASIFFVRTRI